MILLSSSPFPVTETSALRLTLSAHQNIAALVVKRCLSDFGRAGVSSMRFQTKTPVVNRPSSSCDEEGRVSYQGDIFADLEYPRLKV